MFEGIDIALPFDRQWEDDSGNLLTVDRSRHGIDALVGDGVTASTMPTWDPKRGLYTFDGGDYLTLKQNNDVKNVLANMGAIQDETYIWFFDPFVGGSVPGAAYRWIRKALSNPQFYIRHDTIVGQRRLNMTFVSLSGTESSQTAVDSINAWEGRRILFAFVRTLNRHLLYMNDGVLIHEATPTSRDASNSSDAAIGADPGGGTYLPSGTGFRFFGYARKAFTANKLRAIMRFFEELL